MKIVYVFHSLALWGGIERILTDKANWLAARGHEVTLITTDQGRHPLTYPLGEGVSHVDLGVCFHHQYRYRGLRRLLDLWQRHRLFRKEMKAQLRRLQPDVLLCTTTAFVGQLVRWKGRVPLVVESHTICQRAVDGGPLRGLRRWWLFRQLRRADMLVALTEGDAAQWRRHLSHVAVIPNMVHVPDPLPTAMLTARRVIFVGRLEEQKQVDRLLSAWRLVWPTHRDWTLTVCGDGSQQGLVRQLSEQGTEGVELIAPTPRIFDCYAGASMLVLTSAYEPFGLVMAEAMMCGVPVVAFDCPYGPRAIVSDGVSGLLVPPQDDEALAAALARLMDDEALRRRMGAAAARSARRFVASQVMPQWETLFVNLPKRQG